MVAPWPVGNDIAGAAETALLLRDSREHRANCRASLLAYRKVTKQVAREQEEMAATSRARILASLVVLRLSAVS
jgi:hypothetical protein